MLRTNVKRRSLSDIALTSLWAKAKGYMELDINSVHFRVKRNEQKSWQLRCSSKGIWSWLRSDVSGAEPRKKQLPKAHSKHAQDNDLKYVELAGKHAKPGEVSDNRATRISSFRRPSTFSTASA
jgi:hypothetical protein